MRYEIKPDSVEAVLFRDTTGSAKNDYNWHEVVNMLGEYRTEIDKFGDDDTDKEYMVFDVRFMKWLKVDLNTYVCVDAKGAATVWSKEDFENKYQPVVHKALPGTMPTYPGPGRPFPEFPIVTYTNGVITP